MKKYFVNPLVVILIGMSVCLSTDCSKKQDAEQKISEFGRYEGYSTPIYDSWVRKSQYVPVRDGTKLAMDIIRPALNGKVASEPLPVIWAHQRYHRASIVEGNLRSIADSAWIQMLLKHGYIIVVVDTRGGGASFGSSKGFFSSEEAQDAYDITEWLAVQPWSDGNIGMFGGSYLGTNQYFAAAQAPPHLKAIVPEVAFFDTYPFINWGGVSRDTWISGWNHFTSKLDQSEPTTWFNLKFGPVAPVDEDPERKMLAEAIKEHSGNWDMEELLTPLRYRNSVHKASKTMIYLERSPWSFKQQIEESGVAIYHMGAWLDYFPRDTLLWFRNLKNPQKAVIGSWYHSRPRSSVIDAEKLRWYDYWLKGMENGIMDEPPLHYWTMGTKEGEEWRTTEEWPLDEARLRPFYFQKGPSGSIESKNDGLLVAGVPQGDKGQNDYKVDYSTTTGFANRWRFAWSREPYPDMTPNDQKGLTYTTQPLELDVEVTGHPVVHLWVASTAKDGDFFVYLEEVDANGKSNYVTEGTLRASHRAVSEPLYDYMGMPFHRHFMEDMEEMPKEPVELAFDLHPISNIFDKGNRIRVTITCADKDNTSTPEMSSPPTISVYHNKNHASYIALPVVSVMTKE